MRILEGEAVTSQAQLVARLDAEGIAATQATVSRDLDEIAAVKVRIPGGAMVYAVPEQSNTRAASDEHLARIMREFVVRVIASGNLVVVHTPVGSAHVVASAIDRHGFEGVIGTVAGDDTILLVCAEGLASTSVADAVCETAGLPIRGA